MPPENTLLAERPEARGDNVPHRHDVPLTRINV
jgi:hypothetical protein